VICALLCRFCGSHVGYSFSRPVKSMCLRCEGMFAVLLVAADRWRDPVAKAGVDRVWDPKRKHSSGAIG
jgi:hypothetical protein